MCEVCNFGKIDEENNVTYLHCEIVDGYCPFIRFCNNDNCIKMLPSYKDCKNRKLKLAGII